MLLTSTKNPLLQKIRTAASRGEATSDGLIVSEGPHLLEEALEGKWRVHQILATPDALSRHNSLFDRAHSEIVEVAPRAFASIASTEAHQGVLTLLRPAEWTWDDLLGKTALVTVLDAIQDPGNAGTIVRSAEAFGATGVVFLKGCARVANGKLLRATAGSIFRLPYLEAIDAFDLIAWLRSRELPLYALAANGSLPLFEADLRASCALAAGSEGAGICGELLSFGQTVRIPITKIESLNAAIACSIALFWAQQQRRNHELVR